MQRLVYWVAYPFLWVVSKMPFPLFYFFSDCVCFVVYHIVRYRRATVRNNLELVFPDKAEKERQRIEKKFYRHMCDMFLEMIKSISISETALKKRFVYTNAEEINRIQQSGKSIILLYGHYASYEWSNALQLYDIGYEAFGIYKKLKNHFFDKLAHKIRGRFHAKLIPTFKATSQIAKNEHKNIRGIYAFIADQSPKWNKASYWTKFMGITCPAFIGGEVIAKRLDMAVMYLHVEKVRRGHYQATLKTLAVETHLWDDFSITETFLRELEKQIYAHPEYYLWTHKRWKHKDRPIPEDATTAF